jgi:hypothetical protein
MLPLQIMKPIRKRSASKQRGVDSEDGAESGSGRGLDPDVNQIKITSEEETWLLDITARLFPDAPAGVAQLAVPCFATPVPTEENHRKCLTLEVAVQSAQAVIGHGHTIQTATQPPADVLDCEASARASSGPSARHLSLPDEEEIDDMRWLDPFLSPSMSDDAQHFRGHAEWPSMAGPGSTLNDELEDSPCLQRCMPLARGYQKQHRPCNCNWCAQPHLTPHLLARQERLYDRHLCTAYNLARLASGAV